MSRTEHPSITAGIAPPHLDFYTSRRDAEVERLMALGAIRYPGRYRPNDDFIVLQDPDGNRFCAVQKDKPKPAEPAGGGA